MLRSALVLVLLLTSAAVGRAQTVPLGGGADLTATQGFPASGVPGLAAGVRAGLALGRAGDLNGDGYDDLVVGVPDSDVPGTNAGQVYVYFGGPTASATPDRILDGLDTNEAFGSALAGPGDLNNDGYDDLAVGAPGWGGSDIGRVHIFFGGPVFDTTADLFLFGPGVNAEFGDALAAAGDIDGDGHPDLIVGAPGAEAELPGGTFVDAGGAFVYRGGPDLDATADGSAFGEGNGDNFGGSVAGVGDVDGDGRADWMAGAPLNDGTGFNTGRAYLFLGLLQLDATADLTMTGANGDQVGVSVAGAGDVNGDGYDDLLIGANGADLGGATSGAAYVFLGGATPDAVPDLTLPGEAVGDQFGAHLDGAGDINGDGYDDLVIGARNHDAVATSSGRAYVFYGGSALDATPDIVVDGTGSQHQLGIAVAGVGDLDGDGLADVAVGAPNADPDGKINAGFVRLISDANHGLSLAVWRATGTPSTSFGNDHDGSADLNGDGYDDLAIAARNDDGAAANSGAVFIYFGGPDADDTADLILRGSAANERFGTALSGLDDLNGDGYDDLVVSSADRTGQTGRAFVYYGGPTLDATPDVILDDGDAVGTRFGFDVSDAGDVNADGYTDLLVGEQNFAFSSGVAVGRVYLYLGGPTGSPLTTVILDTPLSDPQGARFGGTVSGAGDLNGDGFADLAVGAVFGGSPVVGGAVILYAGTATPTVDVPILTTLFGPDSNDLLGGTIAPIGDWNADGYDDLAIGAQGAGSTRQAQVFLGGLTISSTPFANLGSENDFTTGVVAAIGDMNGDGYPDLGVGSGDEGAAVFFGGASPSLTPDLTVAGVAKAVSGGDLNGDGRADLFVQSDDVVLAYRATGPAAAPGLYRLADVPGDQGGALDIAWTRSDGERRGDVTQYLVQRSRPAGLGGYAWEALATVPVSGEARYSAVVPTYSDQTTTNPGTACLRVTAQGAAGELWRSRVRCGASIDNLAPAAPDGLLADASADGDVLVSVETLSAPPADLAGYTVFRSTDATCDAGDTALGTVADDGSATVLFEDDATPFGTDVFYCATATDVHGNRSAFVGAASANPAVLAAIKVVLQGAYDGSLTGGALMRTDLEDVLPTAQPYAAFGYTGLEAIDLTDESPANGRPDVLDAFAVVDWVLVELRTDPTVTSDKRAAALLLADGTLLDPATSAPFASVRPAAPGSYHVAVTHRNHLAAMSRFQVALSGTTVGTEYDLSASPALVYGTNAVVDLGGRYGLAAGDADGDGSVLAGDRQSIWLPAVGQAGYLPADLNLDGSVLADDRQSFWTPNVGRASQVPGAANATGSETDRALTAEPTTRRPAASPTRPARPSGGTRE